MSLIGDDSPKARRGILVVALATFVMLGLADGSLGVAWPSLRGEFDRGISELGALLAFGSVGYLAASTAYGRVHSRLGTGAAIGTGCFLMTLGLLGVALAPVWLVVALSTVFLGLGGSSIPG